MDDKQIIELYFERNEQAIKETDVKYGAFCHRIAMNILDIHEDAEECVNDTYLNAWNSMPPHRPSILSTFLGKITRNLSLNRCKYNTAVKRSGSQVTVVYDEIAEFVSDKDNVEQEIDRNELLQAIDTFLHTLSAEKRVIFVRRYWYFDSISNISSRLGMTENHVSVTLNRLRFKLRSYLLERGFEL